jgi:5-methylthioadenosine/S-adenosylhomocysteine deaminase
MLQEMGYVARHYGIGSGDLLNMATSIPAKLVRISDYVGVLERDKYADFVVINAKVDPTKPNPLDPIIRATPADVALVIAGGQPIYGDPGLLKQLLPSGTDLST